MRVGKWQFDPSLWPSLATLVLLVVLVLLGMWQLRRAEYKVLAATPIDQFPYSGNLESVVVLGR